MKTLSLLCLALPALTGCLATGNLMQLGRKSEWKFRVDEVRHSNAGPSYLVEYTATVGQSTIGSGSSDETRYQVLTPGLPPPPRGKDEPSGFGPDQVVSLKRVASMNQVGGLPADQRHRAFVVDKEILVLLTRDGPSGGVMRSDFAFTRLDYREPYAYPLMVAGLPVALAIDMATFPFQVLLMASAFSHPEARQ